MKPHIFRCSYHESQGRQDCRVRGRCHHRHARCGQDKIHQAKRAQQPRERVYEDASGLNHQPQQVTGESRPPTTTSAKSQPTSINEKGNSFCSCLQGPKCQAVDWNQLSLQTSQSSNMHTGQRYFSTTKNTYTTYKLHH